jgi:hypothetical protein
MLRNALVWAAACSVLFWAWLFFNGQWTQTELIAAGCAGAIGAMSVQVIRRCGFQKVHFRAEHLRRLWRPLWEIFPQFLYVAAEAFRGRRGSFVADRAAGATGRDDPVGRAERVFLVYADTLSPNDYVVEVDRERKEALRHLLVRGRLTDLP